MIKDIITIIDKVISNSHVKSCYDEYDKDYTVIYRNGLFKSIQYGDFEKAFNFRHSILIPNELHNIYHINRNLRSMDKTPHKIPGNY